MLRITSRIPQRSHILALSFLITLALCSVVSTSKSQPLFANDLKTGRSHPFDVLHIAIDVRFNMASRQVIGTVRHTVAMLDTSATQIVLDAASNMEIGFATIDGKKSRFSLANDKLTITLPKHPACYRDSTIIEIQYKVVPQKGLYFIMPDSANPGRRSQIWTQGEAEDNHFWVPLYDYPNDRATTEVSGTVPGNWKLLSNGELGGMVRNSDGTTTWHYVMPKPQASYLIVLAAGDYMVTRDSVHGIPLEYWTYPDMPDRVGITFGRTPDIISYYEHLLGVPYPWNKYAQITIANFMYGGMENTTATTMNDVILVDQRGRVDYNPDDVVAHEAAHQWFGDYVTNRTWKDLWLHESFATYLASRYAGYHQGNDVLVKQMFDNGNAALGFETTNGRDPIVAGRGQTPNVYQRGSRVLYMLNTMLGEDLFWRGCRLYLERNALGNAETIDLRRALEDVSGLNLEWFFAEWASGAGTPAYDVSYEYGGDSLRMRVRQTQVIDSLTGFFSMPIVIEAHSAHSIVSDTIWVSKADEFFTFALREKPQYLIFDAGNSILKRTTFTRTDAELIAQLAAPRMIDRLLAVQSLAAPDSIAGHYESRGVALGAAFRSEKSPYVREEMVRSFGHGKSSASNPLIALAFNDSSVDVRRAAVEASYILTDSSWRSQLLRERLSDSSSVVILSALDMLVSTEPNGLEEPLRKLSGLRGRRDRLAHSWLNAVTVGRYRSLIDSVVQYTSSDFTPGTIEDAYFAIGAIDTTTAAVRDALLNGLHSGNERIRFAAATAVWSHRDAVMIERIKADLATTTDPEVKQMLEAIATGSKDSSSLPAPTKPRRGRNGR